MRDKWSRATAAKRGTEPPEDSQSHGGILESHDLPTYRHVSCNNKVDWSEIMESLECQAKDAIEFH